MKLLKFDYQEIDHQRLLVEHLDGRFNERPASNYHP